MLQPSDDDLPDGCAKTDHGGVSLAFPKFFHRQKRPVRSETVPLLLAPSRAAPAESLPLRIPDTLPAQEYQLYDALRFAVPVIDAAIRKIVRLSGGFRLTAENPAAQAVLDRFANYVPVNVTGMSLQLFADQMMDSLIIDALMGNVTPQKSLKPRKH